MTDRMEALRAKFRASVHDRLRKLAKPLERLGAGTGTEEDLKALGRELHAMKGDAGVVGLSDLVGRLHVLEEHLAVARALEPSKASASFSRLAADLDALAQDVVQAPPENRKGAALTPLETRERFTRVETQLLDTVSDRVLTLSETFGRIAAQVDGSASALRRAGAIELVDAIERARVQLEELMTAAWTLRLSPLEATLQLLARHARDLAASRGKELEVKVEASGIEIERSVLDGLTEPIVHLVRNAVDHGVEAPSERGGKPRVATLKIAAEAVGGNIEVTVSDDGRGLDVEKIRHAGAKRGFVTLEDAQRMSEQAVLELLFLHGFSTAAGTTELSGRGVGLDLVRRRVEALGGAVSVSLPPHGGTTFTLTVPTALSREHVVVIEHAGGLYAFPSHSVRGLLRLADHPWTEVAGGLALRWNGEALPYHSIGDILGLASDEETSALVLDAQGRRVAVGVARLVAEHDLLRRPADALVSAAGLVVASAMLDDGRCVLLPAIPALLRRIDAGPNRRARQVVASLTPRRVLVVDDSAIVRDLVCSILDALGYETLASANGAAAIERLESELPDLVVCDVEMPVMDGFEVLRLARSRWPHLPFVMLTTRGAPDDRRLAATLGANAYLVKSEFEQARLVETVQRLVSAAR